MYPNLLIEAKRRKVTQKQMSEICNVRRSTINKKISNNGTFTIEEAINLRKAFFPDCTFEYLFEKS